MSGQSYFSEGKVFKKYFPGNTFLIIFFFFKWGWLLGVGEVGYGMVGRGDLSYFLGILINFLGIFINFLGILINFLGILIKFFRNFNKFFGDFLEFFGNFNPFLGNFNHISKKFAFFCLLKILKFF